MDESTLEMVLIGNGGKVSGGAREIAVSHRPGGQPGLIWLGGFRSDMEGSKATALDAYAARRSLACTRFDYSGHGRSGGRFEDGTISRWLEEAEAVFRQFGQGRQIVVGSSMGGWIALLLAERLAGSGQVAGLVLIAPAVDMTRKLMWDKMDACGAAGTGNRRRDPGVQRLFRRALPDHPRADRGRRNPSLRRPADRDRGPRAHPAGHGGHRRAVDDTPPTW